MAFAVWCDTDSALDRGNLAVWRIPCLSIGSMFRTEALADHRGRLHGDVHLVLPISWQLIGYSFLALLGAAAAFLFLSSYARVETVNGQIEPDLGAATIVPTRPGIVTSVVVTDGQQVKAGAPLATIRAEELDQGGASGPQRTLKALGDQDSRLAAEEQSTLATATATRARLRDQAGGLRAEIASLGEQIAAQHQLVASAQDELTRVQTLVGKGFISRHDVQTHEDALTSRQQQMAALEQVRADKMASLAGTARAVDEASSQAQATAAGIAGERAAVSQHRSDVEAARGYTLTAPIDGVATAVVARVGQPAQATGPLMTIVAAGAHLEAQLYVPTQASGFLAVGQDVRLEVDAFPYSSFGTVRAIIKRISSAAVSHVTGTGQSEPVYLVTATIAGPRIYGFGRYHALQPGMTLSARIITEKRSLAEWLFEPLLAVRRR